MINMSKERIQRFFVMRTIFLFIFLMIFVVSWLIWSLVTKNEISNFEECAKAGNPVMESYPEQCRANGQTFVKEY